MGKWSSWSGLGAGSLCTTSSGRLGAGLAGLLCLTLAPEVTKVFLYGLDLFLLGIVGVASSSKMGEELRLGDVLQAALLEETFTATFCVMPECSLTLELLFSALELLFS